MPQRSQIEMLPIEVREQLEQRLIANGFSDYAGLAAWLSEQGYEIHKSSVHRFGATFEDRLRALKASTDQARAVVAASPDDEGKVNEAVMRLTQQQIFETLMELKVDPEQIEFPKLVSAIATLNRSSLALKLYQQQVRERAAQAAKAVGDIARKRGMSQESVDEIYELVLGVAK